MSHFAAKRNFPSGNEVVMIVSGAGFTTNVIAWKTFTGGNPARLGAVAWMRMSKVPSSVGVPESSPELAYSNRVKA